MRPIYIYKVQYLYQLKECDKAENILANIFRDRYQYLVVNAPV